MFGLFSAIAVPAAAIAGIGAPSDGSLVVQKGQAPYTPGGAPNVPVVQLTITGSVIGQVTGVAMLLEPNTRRRARNAATPAGFPNP